MRKLSVLALALIVGLAVACGGGSSTSSTTTTTVASGAVQSPSTAATGLVYTDPTSTGWRLVKDSASTPNRLLLNLVGPSGLMTRGVAFNLQAPATVKFGAFHVVLGDGVHTTDFPIKDLGVYQLLNMDGGLGWYPYTPGVHHPLEPYFCAGGVKKGNLLTVGIFQKDRRWEAKDSGQPLCQIAIEFDPTAKLSAGDALPLTITKAKYMAQDIGAFAVSPTLEMIQKAHLVDAQIALGSLHAN